MNPTAQKDRTMGLMGATGVGVGAIVGGGILALAGAALASTGPAAIVAFAVNGLIALLTALSFAEVSTKFPESGGAYIFSKRVLSVEAAFVVGWIVWFASIVAAVLYAFGFGLFAAAAIGELWRWIGGESPSWLSEPTFVNGLAITSIVLYALGLLRGGTGGGKWANIGKVAVFAVLIAAGFWALRDRSGAEIAASMTPFLSSGLPGLVQAMGFTFIALQGFDLIAAVAGDIRTPERTIPRAMLLSLGIALSIYLPLLFLISVVGVDPGDSITELAGRYPETVIALAVENYLGKFGYWLVVVAAILSMLSALRANLLAASHVAMSMARDRTLPLRLARLNSRQSPATAILLTALIVVVILVALPDLAAAGAAASLIFLITFSLVHGISVLVRQRSQARPPPFRTPLYPAVPLIGGLACLALAIYQGLAVPTAGAIASAWICLGAVLFLGLFAARARVVDATSSALDPEVRRMRGHSPLVLVPTANPQNSRNLISVAGALSPPEVGSALILSIVVAPADWQPDANPEPLEQVQRALGRGISASVSMGVSAEALATVASDPWKEIGRVAKSHNCETILLGLRNASEELSSPKLEELINVVDCDLVLLRAPQDWQLANAQRILVPIRGRGDHDPLLARLLASLSRRSRREVTFLRMLKQTATRTAQVQAQRRLNRLAIDIAPGWSKSEVVLSDSPLQTIVGETEHADLLVLGVQRLDRSYKSLGPFVQNVAQQVRCPLLIISRRG